MSQYAMMHGLFTEKGLSDLLDEIRASPKSDGVKTVSGFARGRKKNRQIMPSDNEDFINRLTSFIAQHEEFNKLTLARWVTGVRIVIYEPGMEYGRHADMPHMDGVRTDMSFTLFLSDPNSYGGGELMIETEFGEQAFKLPAGSMLLYPTGVFHRVSPVTEGVRIAAVGWVQSLVHDAAHREILLDLLDVENFYLEKCGMDRNLELLGNTRLNLIRLWSD